MVTGNISTQWVEEDDLDKAAVSAHMPRRSAFAGREQSSRVQFASERRYRRSQRAPANKSVRRRLRKPMGV